ncbi:MAG: thioredoxin domain-containing protein [Alphaproteobacteria bacterium]|nr:thioredoxin domain-containing protein [Alphaproteobacteria bacterium]
MKILRSLMFIIVLAYFLQALMNDEMFRGQFEKNLELLNVGSYEQADYTVASEEERKSSLKQGLVMDDGETVGVLAGNQVGKVVLVEFYDFSCIYCKKIASNVLSVIRNNADLRVVLVPLSIVGPFSEYASRAFFAAAEQGKTLEMYEELLVKTQRLNRKSIDAAAQNVGLDMKQYYADIKSRKFDKQMREMVRVLKEFQIKSVPALFLNGEKVSGQNASVLQSEVDNARTLQKKIKEADDAGKTHDDALSLLHSMGNE